jgi:hypothetical protein
MFKEVNHVKQAKKILIFGLHEPQLLGPVATNRNYRRFEVEMNKYVLLMINCTTGTESLIGNYYFL